MSESALAESLDPLTGQPRPWTFQGWMPWVETCRRWRAECPWMLTNAIQGRAEVLQGERLPADVFDRNVMVGQLLVRIAIAELVRQEVL